MVNKRSKATILRAMQNRRELRLMAAQGKDAYEVRAERCKN